ncbi:Gfo/Idh/MocA family protein [Goodfellowiella coeruleoviolacea]|uniref:Oxidoreductase family, NAD-binding Rossmann fold n=1 Tax=Goodfellowiella coeruleoviolacea TaxID=334858 RepID=A0AAE3GHX5_9PSEU|nr:Gfo/Idh/MocA family oxidoreductase [Goodfellowiella coeruleoviolacea]MCP2167712.1 Oxidoreductase family, NAD-binding Rossmann fold [Goodfellowiella coeruleoviolacea]
MTDDVDHPVRFDVLGCARVAWRHFLPALALARGASLTAVASRDQGRAERFAREFGCAAVTGYRALLDRDDVDAVYLPLPTGLHARWAAEALRAGKHVLVEKPMATTRADAEELVELARRVGRCVAENRMFAHHPQHEAVRALVADGAIGALRVVTSAMAVPPLPTHAPVVRVERPGRGDGLRLPAADQFREAITAFARAVRAGAVRPDVLAATLRGLELVDAVREAA